MISKILILGVVFVLNGCAVYDVIDGLHGFKSGKSEPAYPPEIALQPCLWTEGGQTSLIDQYGVHPLNDLHQPAK